MVTAQISLPTEALVRICKRYHVRELALFGSAVTGQLHPESDVDFLVEFNSDAEVGFLALAGMQRELSTLVGRPADLVPKSGLKSLIRNEVLSSARIVYEEYPKTPPAPESVK